MCSELVLKLVDAISAGTWTAIKLTSPVNPNFGVTLIVEEAVALAARVKSAGDASTSNPGDVEQPKDDNTALAGCGAKAGIKNNSPSKTKVLLRENLLTEVHPNRSSDMDETNTTTRVMI